MKTIQIIGFLFLATIALSSCKKCVECSYTDDIGATKVAESCKKKANKSLETDMNDQWGKYGPVTCSNK